MKFENRSQAGKLLAQDLLQYKNRPDAIVLGIPRGGIVVAYEVSRKLHLSLSVYISRKIAAPNDPELGIGAISELNTVYILKRFFPHVNVSEKEFWNTIFKEKKELQRRIKLYRKNIKLPVIRNKTVLLVDDGLAMGVTAIASILSLQKRKPKKIIFSSPVCAYENLKHLKKETEVEVVTLYEYHESAGIGHFYKNFKQTSDTEIQNLLQKRI
jgi:putative phosphoribosyl transferase